MVGIGAIIRSDSVRFELEKQLRGGPLLAHGATRVAAVAGKLKRIPCVFTILAAVLLVLANPAIARRMFAFSSLFMHAVFSCSRRFPYRFSDSMNFQGFAAPQI